MDKAQITVLRLQGQEVQTPAPAPTTGQAPALIPGIPPELQQMGQQALQGLQQLLPPGLIPPGLVPGQAPAATPVQPAQPRFKNFVILSQRQLGTDDADTELKEQMLDVFGDEDSFSAERGNCFYPGLGVSIVRPNNPVPIDLLISLSCNQAMGDGFRWPYKVNGFTTETHQALSKIYEKLWGPVPPGA
jgi:RNase P/RNase MRP subunit POP5